MTGGGSHANLAKNAERDEIFLPRITRVSADKNQEDLNAKLAKNAREIAHERHERGEKNIYPRITRMDANKPRGIYHRGPLRGHHSYPGGE